MELSDKVIQAHKQAVLAMSNSYAPYSNLHVSAAIQIKESLVTGVNVENVSYGATICAERSALVSARSQYGEIDIEFVVVISDIKGEPIPPCGMCLQVLSEFADGDTEVYLGNQQELSKKYQLKDFLPQAFSKERLLD